MTAASPSLEIVLVCGPWSSGTTAVAGVLARLGVKGLPPYLGTVDERTPNSHESVAFRSVIDEVASESTVAVTASPQVLRERLRAFGERVQRQEHGAYGGGPLFFKYPLSALVIPAICEVFPTRLIYVLRPIQDIEATRARRNWGLHTGAQGAHILYGAMFSALVEQRIPMPLMIRFVELLEDPASATREIARFVGLDVGPQRLDAAAAFVRRSRAPHHA